MEISPSELNNWLNEIDSSLLQIIDCREPDEWDICHIEGARLIPLSVFVESINKFKGYESYDIRHILPPWNTLFTCDPSDEIKRISKHLQPSRRNRTMVL
ncbi:rhodanese-like domain-containing protein [Verrucomicrobiales bacterium]|nr:rhodanese-like domain-containing protein [Verrucomicrobiales bacterium]